MGETLFRLNGTAHLLVAVVGMLISVLVWRWSARKSMSFVAIEMRLLFLAFTTAGVVVPGKDGYVLFWLVMITDFLRPYGFSYLYVFCAIFILIYWVIYSVIYFWARWMYRENSC